MRLTIRDSGNNWYVIERAEHEGGVGLKWTANGRLSLHDSARFSDADIEGTAEEMIAVAQAIQQRKMVSFKRCAVRFEPDVAVFWSPRNSQIDGICSHAEADHLMADIIALLQSKDQSDEIGAAERLVRTWAGNVYPGVPEGNLNDLVNDVQAAIDQARAEALEEAAVAVDSMIVGGRQWTEEQQVDGQALAAAACNLRDLAKVKP